MENKFEIGEKIKSKRLQLNLRMDDVAKEVSVTRSTLWSIENGNGNYTIDILLKLLSFLDMSIDIDEENQGTRKRATRVNTVLDKKINRFIVMCVEQYAASVNQGSGDIYRKLEKNGIIDELKEDYEGLSRKYWNHGLMTEACKAFIKHLFNKDFNKVLIKAVVENIGSNRVIEKCGFKFTHQECLEHQSSFKPNSVTLNCYELIK